MIVFVIDDIVNEIVAVYSKVTAVTAIEKEKGKLATITYKDDKGEYKKDIEDLNRYTIEII